MSKTRVRFAPSPTGSLHVGNLRTALFNWLYSNKTGGAFILRIEDTDLERSNPEAEKELMSSLHKLGLTWDEGPDIGGSFGPYRQNERGERYKNAVKRLLESDAVYLCYCSTEELESERKAFIAAKKPPRYSGKCRNLTDEERSRYEGEGIAPSYRFKVEGGKVEFLDGVRGHVSFKASDIGDFIIVRSDGSAAYYLASALDDIEMEITDIIRGEDHLSNTPKQILIMKALGATPPKYHHLSIILGKNGQKLSKRSGSADVASLLNSGYLPNAINTAIAMLGWSGVAGKEAETLEAMAKKFDISKVSKAPSHFDPDRLDHINSKAIKKTSAKELIPILKPVMEGFPFEKFDEPVLLKIIDAVKDSIQTPSDAMSHAEQFVKLLEPDDNIRETLNTPETRMVMKSLKSAIEQINVVDEGEFKTMIKSVSSATGLGGKKLFQPIRAIVTGRAHGPSLKDIFSILGREEILKRIKETEKRI